MYQVHCTCVYVPVLIDVYNTRTRDYLEKCRIHVSGRGRSRPRDVRSPLVEKLLQLKRKSVVTVEMELAKLGEYNEI